MQEKEFDKLMDGQPSKMAFLPDNISLDRITKEYVKLHEVTTPKSVVSAVDIWVDRCRKLGMSEKNIRKSVLHKFKIKVIKSNRK
jgi:hypothetical protein